MSISTQTVAECDFPECPQEVSSPSAPSDAGAWLDTQGWVQFKRKTGKASTADVLTFCPTHFATLRQFFGPLDASVGTTLTQGKAA